jgi:hypothetical protein
MYCVGTDCKSALSCVETYPRYRGDFAELGHIRAIGAIVRKDISALSGRLCGAGTYPRHRVNYIHNNPVKDKVVALPEDYYFSSARNYAGLENDLDVVMLDLF